MCAILFIRMILTKLPTCIGPLRRSKNYLGSKTFGSPHGSSIDFEQVRTSFEVRSPGQSQLEELTFFCLHSHLEINKQLFSFGETVLALCAVPRACNSNNGLVF